MKISPIHTEIVLVGGGHTHLHVLKSFAMKPQSGIRITLISPTIIFPYSGMLPGFIAGHYSSDDLNLDLLALTHAAKARVIKASVTHIDTKLGSVILENRPPVRYDILSVGVGITPDLDEIEGAKKFGIPVKPISEFVVKWENIQKNLETKKTNQSFVVVGGGAAGFELILAVQHRLRGLGRERGLKPECFSYTLIAGGSLLPNYKGGARYFAKKFLQSSGITLIEHDPVRRVEVDAITLESGKKILADTSLLATPAKAPSWFVGTDLSLDKSGFISVRPTLQTLKHDHIFAVGDCASILEHPREKSGVFAVRQGPILTHNLLRLLDNKPLRSYKPQRRFLSLISLGDRRAIASRGSLAITGAWVWKWKDRIDRKFLNQYNFFSQTQSMSFFKIPSEESDIMRCGGCASKVGPLVLNRALDRFANLKIHKPDAKYFQFPLRDDAAILQGEKDLLRLETIDFIKSFWSDPYLFGEIVARHSLNDIFAMGGTPKYALSVVVLPLAKPKIIEEDLFQILAGAQKVFSEESVELIGGHSSEGLEFAAGFSISGTVSSQKVLTKKGLQPSDKLILSRPLGTGVLFAAHMQGQVKGSALFAALETMCRSNRLISEIACQYQATAMTDITGFGLAGHLLEMLDQSGQTAEVILEDLPIYETVRDLLKLGFRSTLHEQNALQQNVIQYKYKNNDDKRDDSDFEILFDPQTSGGLLFGVPNKYAKDCLSKLHSSGVLEACIIGEVISFNRADRSKKLLIRRSLS